MRIIWGTAIAATAMVFGQTEAPQPAFEVASVKVDTAGEKTGMFPTPGTLSVFNLPLKVMISQCYRLQPYQISGGENWMDSVRYDIAGKAAGPAKFNDMIPMLKTLLTDRFQLKFHWETRTLPGYWLVIAKGGPRIRRPDELDTDPGSRLRNQPTSIEGHKMPIAQLLFFLQATIRMPILDKTGLEGDFNFKLEWTDNQRPPTPGELPDVEKPSLFAAVQEQLGLKLELHPGPVQVLVIDHAEKPTVN